MLSCSVMSGAWDPLDHWSCWASLSVGFSRQECWSGLHFPLQGIVLTQRSNRGLLRLLRWSAGTSSLHHRVCLSVSPQFDQHDASHLSPERLRRLPQAALFSHLRGCGGSLRLPSSLTREAAAASSGCSAPVFASSAAFVHSQSRSQSESEKWVRARDASNPNCPEAPVRWEPWPAVAGPLCDVSDLIFYLSPSRTPCQPHWLLGCSSNKTELHLRVSMLGVLSALKSLPPNIHMAETFISYKSLLHSRLVKETTPALLKNRISDHQDSQFPFTLPQFFFPHHFPPPSIL